MYKQSKVGTKKVSMAADKAKKPTKKIVKVGKTKKKQINASSTILKDSTISSAMEIRPADIGASQSESWSLTESIRQFVRQEVEEALMKISIKREMTHKAASKENIANVDEYVKLEDLNGIVNTLISQNIESVVERNSDKIQETEVKVFSLEENIKNLTARMKAVEESVREMHKGYSRISAGSQETGRVVGMRKPTIRFQIPDKERPSASKLMPQIGSASKVKLPIGLRPGLMPSKSSEDSDDDSEDLESSTSTEMNDEKARIYDELIQKFNRENGGQQLDLASAWNPSQKVDPRIACLEKDLQKRMTERHQFETNMLRYKKSPLTLQLDSHKKHFPNEGGGSLAQGQRKRLGHPRLSRPPTPKISDEKQSDWLFEQ